MTASCASYAGLQENDHNPRIYTATGVTILKIDQQRPDRRLGGAYPVSPGAHMLEVYYADKYTRQRGTTEINYTFSADKKYKVIPDFLTKKALIGTRRVGVGFKIVEMD